MNKDIIYTLPQGILNWYDFKEGSHILCVYNNNSSIVELLQQNKGNMTVVASMEEIEDCKFQQTFKKYFDYIVAINVLEKIRNIKEDLIILRTLITENGKLLLGTENRLGIRYFVGDKDPYTGKVWSGIEGYHWLGKEEYENMNGRCYSKAEIERYLKASGWDKWKNYAVLPNLDSPQLLFAEGYKPKEELSIRYVPRYRSKETVFSREEYLYTDLIENGLFNGTANSFLFECSPKEEFSKAEQITIAMDRGEDDSIVTIINDDGTVIKKALYAEGIKKFKKLQKNMEMLEERKIPVIKGELNHNIYIMPYIDTITANMYLQQLMIDDVDKFIESMDEFRNLILNSSDIISNDKELGPILKVGYPDMVPLNALYYDGKFVFIDQEFTINNYPANAIIYRSIAIVYQWDIRREAILPMNFFWKRYGLEKNLDYWQKMSEEFTNKLTNQDKLYKFNLEQMRNDDIVNQNKFRMNYSEKDFEEMFYNPFVGIENKKLYLFGSGRYAEKFIAMYHLDYDIEALIDNDRNKWNTIKAGYPIIPPSNLLGVDPSSYKIIICVKDYFPILEQLKAMGAVNISIFEKNKVYPGRQANAINLQCKDNTPKKYHIGYLAGVFDLYHIGHLNMFKRAKEMCDYLIVGVVTDEGVRDFKHTEPFIPFSERVEMIRSCRYVDEVVEIPYFYRDTQEAFEKYHFDVQFSGSDYENDPSWIAKKKYLEEHGSTLVFFPYTEQTSSTKIKTLIDQKLI